MTSTTHWTVKSAWSKAGVGTNIVLELKCAPDHAKTKTKKRPACVAFDMGATPCFDDAILANYVFLSHGHIDHVGALFSHARAHAVSCGGEAPTYFVPAQLLPQIEQCRHAMSLIDSFTTTTSNDENKNNGRENLLTMTLVPVNPGDEFPLKGIAYGSKTTFFVRAFEVDHAGHTALGYVMGSRTMASGLKQEYQNLDGNTIRELVQSGVSVKETATVEKIEVAYSGDTCRNGLIKNSLHSPESVEEHLSKSATYLQQAFQAELLICELTFLDSAEDEAQMQRSVERGHLHMNDLEDIFASHGRLNSHDETKSVLFYHLSGRYGPASRALEYIATGLPSQIRNSCHVAIKSLLSEKEKAAADGIQMLIQPNGCISVEDYLRWRKESNNAAA